MDNVRYLKSNFRDNSESTKTTLDRINFEYENCKKDYISDLKHTHLISEENAKKIVEAAFIELRNNAPNYDKNQSLLSWIDEFIEQECADHLMKSHHITTMEQDTLDAKNQLIKEVDLAIDALMKHGNSRHESLWTLIRFFKSIRRENTEHTIDNMSDKKVAEYQRDLLRVLYPRATVTPLTKSDDIIKQLEDLYADNDDTNSPDIPTAG